MEHRETDQIRKARAFAWLETYATVVRCPPYPEEPWTVQRVGKVTTAPTLLEAVEQAMREDSEDDEVIPESYEGAWVARATAP